MYIYIYHVLYIYMYTVTSISPVGTALSHLSNSANSLCSALVSKRRELCAEETHGAWAVENPTHSLGVVDNVGGYAILYKLWIIWIIIIHHWTMNPIGAPKKWKILIQYLRCFMIKRGPKPCISPQQRLSHAIINPWYPANFCGRIQHWQWGLLFCLNCRLWQYQ